MSFHRSQVKALFTRHDPRERERLSALIFQQRQLRRKKLILRREQVREFVREVMQQAGSYLRRQDDNNG